MIFTKPKNQDADELQKQVMELRSEVERLQQTVDNLMMIIIERELEETESEDDYGPLPEDNIFRRYNLENFN